MAEESELISKVEANLGALVDVYTRIYAALTTIDRQKYKPDQLLQLDLALESPASIDAGKVVAILKAIRSSSSRDRFQLESFNSVRTDTGLSVGSCIGDELKALGLSYHDLFPFLESRGWLKAS